jgi:hypothetical protein
MEGTNAASAIPTNQKTVFFSTDKYQFPPDFCQAMMCFVFHKWAFQPQASV